VLFRSKLGDGAFLYGPNFPNTGETNDASIGVDVHEWSAIHVAFYAEDNSYDDQYATIRPWRWYPTLREGHIVAGGQTTGRWIPDRLVEVALDPSEATLARGSHYAWPTLACSKMFFQIISVTDTSGAAAEPDWIVVQPFGLSKYDVGAQPVACIPAGPGSIETLAVHDEPVIADGPQIMFEAKDFDGAALPNTVTEGDAVRPAASLGGVQYVMPVNESGSDTPVVAHSAVISAANGGTVGFMGMVEAKDFDGLPFPNTVTEGDAVRPAHSLSGVGYNMLTSEDGDKTPMVQHNVAITDVGGGTVGLMAMLETKICDGSVFPNVVGAEGNAARPAGSLYGVAWASLVTQTGADTPLLENGTAISDANGGTAVVIAGAEARSSSPALETEGDGVRLITDLAKALIIAGYQYATTSIRMEEIYPLNDKYIPGANVDVTNVAVQGTLYWPSIAGDTIDSWKDFDVHIAVKGGTNGENNAQIDVYLDITSGMLIGGATQWEDGSGAGYVVASTSTPGDADQTIRQLGETSIISSLGDNLVSRVIDWDNLNTRLWRFRIEVTLFDPATVKAEYHIWPRRKAL
jgi:hypothetical protein